MRFALILAAAIAAASPAAGQGRWQLTTDVDPVDDGKTVMLTRHVPLGREWARVRVSCAKGLPRVSISHSQWIGRGRVRAVVRFDDEAPESDEWIATGPLAGPIGHGAEAALIKRMLAARTMAVRLDFTRGGRGYMDTIFVQLGGFAEAFAPVGRACNWAQLYG